MNFKKTAIALAVASVAAAPVIASADGSVYASARIGLQYQDTGGNDSITVRGFGARFGMKGDTDLGNGLTAWGKYEFGVATEGSFSAQAATDVDGSGTIDTDDTVSNTNNVSRRHAVIGLKGDFGNVYIGHTYHEFYNMTVAPVDQPWWGSGYNMVAYRGRTSQSLSYHGDFGPVSVGVSAVMDGSNVDASGDPETLDQLEAAIAFDAGPVRLAGGVITSNGAATAGGTEAEDIYSLTGSGTFGPVGLAVNYQMQERGTQDISSLTIHVGVADFYAHLESADGDGGSFASDGSTGEDPVYLTLGYTHNIGPRTLMYFELSDFDKDTGVSNNDDTRVRAVMKYDIL